MPSTTPSHISVSNLAGCHSGRSRTPRTLQPLAPTTSPSTAGPRTPSSNTTSSSPTAPSTPSQAPHPKAPSPSTAPSTISPSTSAGFGQPGRSRRIIVCGGRRGRVGRWMWRSMWRDGGVRGWVWGVGGSIRLWRVRGIIRVGVVR